MDVDYVYCYFVDIVVDGIAYSQKTHLVSGTSCRSPCFFLIE